MTEQKTDSRTFYERLCNRVALYDRRYAKRSHLRRPIATFTFDDFPSSAYDIGGKLMESAGVQATYFVSGGFLGQTMDGVRYFDEGHLRAAHVKGHEIGCHSFGHEKLSMLGHDKVRQACDDNASFVRKVLGSQIPIKSFAYPFGDTSIWVKEFMARRFEACRGVREAVNAELVDRAQIDIVSLERRHASAFNLEKVITDAVARKGWIVFLTHDVSEDPSPYGSTPAMIDKVLRRLMDAGIQVIPFSAAAALVFQDTPMSPTRKF